MARVISGGNSPKLAGTSPAASSPASTACAGCGTSRQGRCASRCAASTRAQADEGPPLFSSPGNQPITINSLSWPLGYYQVIWPVPGFPVGLVGVDELYAAFLTESRTRGPIQRSVQEIRGGAPMILKEEIAIDLAT